MDELGVNIIPAGSPQAKGRVERLWGTLQSRLPVEFKTHKITNMKDANAFLDKFIEKFNKKFAREPEDQFHKSMGIRDTTSLLIIISSF